MVSLKQNLVMMITIVIQSISPSHLPVFRGAQPRFLPGEVGEGEIPESWSESLLTGQIGKEILSPDPVAEINES